MKNQFELCNDKQFRKTAFDNYTNMSAISYSEFDQDLRKFAYVAKMIKNYTIDPYKISERFLVNQIIIIHNTFGRFTAAGLFYKTEREYWNILKTFLDYLEYLPVDDPRNQIEPDYHLVNILNKL